MANKKGEFLWVWTHIRRKGAKELLDWLEVDTDFFEAPASQKYHLNRAGGLVEHSLNVYKRLREIAVRDLLWLGTEEVFHLSQEEEETIAILGLLHDVCKVGVYHWEGKSFVYRDKLPLGHGEKSLFLITRHMALTEEEALAIRWHMSAYDDAVKGGSRSMNEAMKLTPWVWRLQKADMCAAWIDERSDET